MLLPILILTPIFLFALLHAASASLAILDTLGQNSMWVARLIISLVEFQSRNILRAAALAEIRVQRADDAVHVLLLRDVAVRVTP
ncbi:unnamed protein product [Leptidea sinapis]|uniref:Secreted protein n=1 Tax=Leptidea sinapis TaxID=189913 RepID=A0A5E4QAD0_9NEOP|nr:unnamed protein product [Leptidea sinapis]